VPAVATTAKHVVAVPDVMGVGRLRAMSTAFHRPT